jgi:hypothetical protein
VHAPTDLWGDSNRKGFHRNKAHAIIETHTWTVDREFPHFWAASSFWLRLGSFVFIIDKIAITLRNLTPDLPPEL